MTKEIFQEWITECFLLEIGPIRDPNVPIQFLVDNCTAHNCPILHIQDPHVRIEFLPANTTSLCQPMDQAVLNSVKVSQKMAFYFGLFEHCETNGYDKIQFNEYLKTYTVYNAILDIHKGWMNVPKETIQKSFRKVFPEEKYEQITNIVSDKENDFMGFEQPDMNPVSDRHHVMAKENVPGILQIERTQIVNDAFDKTIEEIVEGFNKFPRDLFNFQKEAIIEDVLQNPGPKDDDLDNIMREELGVQDDDNCEDMLEEDPLTMPIPNNMSDRDIVHHYLKQITVLKNHDLIHKILPDHQKEQHDKLLKELQNLTIKCFAVASDTLILPPTPVHEDEAIPSTSGIDTRVTRTTSFYEPDEPEASHFGTENKQYLDSELHISYMESCDILPDLKEMEVTLKDESSDTEAAEFTFFRALNEKEKTRTSKNGKFDRVEVASSNSDSD